MLICFILHRHTDTELIRQAFCVARVSDRRALVRRPLYNRIVDSLAQEGRPHALVDSCTSPNTSHISSNHEKGITSNFVNHIAYNFENDVRAFVNRTLRQSLLADATAGNDLKVKKTLLEHLKVHILSDWTGTLPQNLQQIQSINDW